MSIFETREQRVQHYLNYHQVEPNRPTSPFVYVQPEVLPPVTYFQDNGMFQLRSEMDRQNHFSGYFFWAPTLLEHDPKTPLRTHQGKLLLGGVGNRIIIPTRDIEVVETIFSGAAQVARGGYVLGRMRGRFSLGGGDNYVQRDELIDILEAADRGVEPPAFTASPFLKVDPSLEGQTLTRICLEDLDHPQIPFKDRTYRFKLISEDRKIVPHRLSQTLSLRRWGKDPSFVPTSPYISSF